MEYVMLTEVRTEEAKAIRRQARTTGKDFSPRRGKILVPRKDGLVQALMASGLTKDHILLATQKSINTQLKSSKDTSQELKTMVTSPRSTQKNYPTLTSSSAASLARRLASPESDEASKIQEVRSSLNSHGLLKKNSHVYAYLRTLKACYLTIKGALLLQSSPPLMNWGMTVNGRCLTAKITAYPKTENASTLSDILEEHPDPKYFLSEEATATILKKSPELSRRLNESMTTQE